MFNPLYRQIIKRMYCIVIVSFPLLFLVKQILESAFLVVLTLRDKMQNNLFLASMLLPHSDHYLFNHVPLSCWHANISSEHKLTLISFANVKFVAMMVDENWIVKINRFHPQGIMNVCAKFKAVSLIVAEILLSGLIDIVIHRVTPQTWLRTGRRKENIAWPVSRFTLLGIQNTEF